jgi:putative transposase
MRSRYGVAELGSPHFVTSTVVSWLPVFTTANHCDIIVESLEYCRQHKGLEIYAWVILDNHIHAILAAPDLSRVMADFKRHTAQRIIEQLEKDQSAWILNQLEFFHARHKTQSVRQFWQEGFHPQAISDDKTMEQKIEYIHNNPVKRGLIAAPEHWRYSSAHELLPGTTPVMKCNRWT